jgi:hypothetical protein
MYLHAAETVPPNPLKETQRNSISDDILRTANLEEVTENANFCFARRRSP